jgi:phosphoglycolate phosphatase
MSLVVGFDLDMTLIDARAGIAATYRALAAQAGVYVDADAAVRRLGPPLREELANWFPPGEVDAAVRAYRSIYPAHLNRSCRRQPGAAAALAAVRRHSGRVVVVTSKLGEFARAHLEHVELAVDEVVGDRFGRGKEAAIIAYHIGVYIGDHVADVGAARAAGAVAVGVASGPCPAEALADAGADPVLPDLRVFPDWLDTWVAMAGARMPRPALPG